MRVLSCLAVAAVLPACLLVLLALGLAERLARDRAWRSIPIRVHVNGSRGKSTVTRLVWAALREAGVPTLAKTTGTLPRLLLPDGTEQPLARRGPASIREQLVLMRRARRLGAKAVVVECMALDPELQWVSEREMLRASIGVITNVRRDHEEVMGRDLDSIAATLANTIPRQAVVVSGDDRYAALFGARAEKVGTRLVSASRPTQGPAPDERRSSPRASASTQVPARWLEEDAEIAMAVARELGIDEETARRGFSRAPRDPGAASSGVLDLPARRLRWLDATAANDPDSLERLMDDAGAATHSAGDGPVPADWRTRPVLVYNHRHDRGPRLLTFARHAEALRTADSVIVTGARPAWTAWRGLLRARPAGETAYVAPGALARRLSQLPADAQVVFCGNTRGFDLPRLLREVSTDG